MDFIDEVVKFELSCTLPCKSCESANKSACISCYSNGLLVSDRTLFDSNTKSCKSACSLGQFNNGAGSCMNCLSPCSECAVSENQCTNCISSPIQYYLSNFLIILKEKLKFYYYDYQLKFN